MLDRRIVHPAPRSVDVLVTLNNGPIVRVFDHDTGEEIPCTRLELSYKGSATPMAYLTRILLSDDPHGPYAEYVQECVLAGYITGAPSGY